MVAKIPDANPIKPLLRAVEHLVPRDCLPLPITAGTREAPPTPAELVQDIAKIDAALTEIVARFQVDLLGPEGPARRTAPIR